MTDHTVRTWDLAVRVFHWSLVLFFALSYLTGESESPIHVYSGYTILGLIVFRILWGLVGSPNARLVRLLYGPCEVAAYLKGLLTGEARHYEGHNPAASWMAIALLASVLATGFSGLKLYGAEGHGPLAADAVSVSSVASARANEDDHDDEDKHERGYKGREHRGEYGAREERGEHDEGEEFWEEVHEFFANFTLLLIIVHVTGAIMSSFVHKENLIKAMFTGNRLAR